MPSLESALPLPETMGPTMGPIAQGPILFFLTTFLGNQKIIDDLVSETTNSMSTFRVNHAFLDDLFNGRKISIFHRQLKLNKFLFSSGHLYFYPAVDTGGVSDGTVYI